MTSARRSDEHSRQAVGITAADLYEGLAIPPLDYDVTATTVVLGALATRDWRPMHHDYKFATERNGTQDIFLNTPNQAHWFERFITDWTGPKGRLGQMTFRMKRSVFPGDHMRLTGTVDRVELCSPRRRFLNLASLNHPVFWRPRAIPFTEATRARSSSGSLRPPARHRSSRSIWMRLIGST